MNGSASNIPDSTGRSFPSPFSNQPGAGVPGFQHTGTLQGLHNMHSSYNLPSMAGTLPSRNLTINIAPSGSMPQSTGNLLTGRFGSNNLPAVLSQISHGSSHGHSGVVNRGVNSIGNPAYNSIPNAVGGSIPGVLPPSASIGNRGAVHGIGVSPHLGNTGSQFPSSMGDVVGSGYINRSSGEALSMPGLASRLNLSSNSGSGSTSFQGPNRFMSSGPQQQASPHVISMLGNSYGSNGSSLSQSHVHAINNLSSMAMLNDANSINNTPFGVDDFPSLSGRPNSAGGTRGQIGSIRKQGIGGPTSQQSHEFSIQNEDFPALPGQKGGNSDYSLEFHQKDQLRDSSVSRIQTQNFSMGRSSGFTIGGTFPSPHPMQHQQHMPSMSGSQPHQQQMPSISGPQQHQQHMPSVSGSLHHQQQMSSINGPQQHQQHMSSISSPQQLQQHMPSISGPQQYQQHMPTVSVPEQQQQMPSNSGGSDSFVPGNKPPDSGMKKSVKDLTAISGVDSYDQQMQHYQQQSLSQFHLRQMSAIDTTFRDQGAKSIQATQVMPDPYCLLGLVSVAKKREDDPDLASLALGIDLMTLGLDLNSSEDLYKTFGSPWSVESFKRSPEFVTPECYNDIVDPVPSLNHLYFMKFHRGTLFYIFYSMPKNEAQLYAASELYRRGWFYHKELLVWFSRLSNAGPLVKTPTYERGSYLWFDPSTWETKRKDDFVLQYDLIERRPNLSQL